MNIKKADLLKVIDTSLTNYRAARAKFDERAKKHAELRNFELAKSSRDRQRELRDALSAALKKGKTLTSQELRAFTRNDSWNSIGSLAYDAIEAPTSSFKNADGVTVRPPVSIPVATLEALKATLEAVTDTEVTDGQLQRWGFKNIGWVFREAVQVQVS